MRNNIDFRKIFYIIYAIIIALAFIIIFIGFSGFKGPSMEEKISHGSISLSEGWLLKDNSIANMNNLSKNAGVVPYEEFSLYNTLPEKIESGVCLFFRSKNILFKVYIDGKLRYVPYTENNMVYTKSGGTNWNFVELLPEDSGRVVELRAYTVYDTERSCFDSIIIDNGVSIIISVLREHGIAIITCLLLIFVGIILIFADIPINRLQRKNHELLFLGLFSLFIALWCFAETNLLQFFSGNAPAIQLISYLSLMLIPFPAMLYLDSAFNIRHKLPLYLVMAASLIEFILCLILHLTKTLDFRESLTFTHVMLFFTAAVMLWEITLNLIEIKKKKIRTLHFIIRVLGLAVFSLGAVLDLIRFYCSSSKDAAMLTRISILIFILCYGIASLEKTIEAVKMGSHAQFVSQLAYKDGLTGIGNRTAFQEHLSELEDKKDKMSGVGIIMFDVNNLKKVNDGLGHHAGDKMLLKSAKIIQSAFENPNSRCFRIGGDEFVVVLDGDNIKTRYENGMNRFDTSIAQYNQLPGRDFSISIANGFALYDEKRKKENNAVTLLDIFQEADSLMYENKKKMKGII